MNIVKQKWDYLNATLDHVPLRVRKLYHFGLKVLAFRKIESLRSNARILDLNWNTAKSKVYRLTKNERIRTVFSQLVRTLHIVKPTDILAVDFSDFGNGFQVLMFAKQTQKGRTVPVYFEVLRYPIEKGSQNIFVIHAIQNLETTIGFKPKLVFDRGFACPSIIRFLESNGHTFYVRIKKNKGVTNVHTGTTFLAKNSRKNDFTINAYYLTLRLVISDKTKNSKERWYLVTNDFKSSRKKIIHIYYFRFEIEEFFRDAKRLLGLEYITFRKETSLAVTLWFVMLGLWFLWHLETVEQQHKNSQKKHHIQRKHMQLSIVRYYLEKIHSEIILTVEGRYMV